VIRPAGPAAGVHLSWAQAPASVQAWAARVGGGPPALVRDQRGGFSPGAVAVLECPRGSIFVKAVGAGLNPDSPDMHRREAAISIALPRAPLFPLLLDTYDDGDWVALAFEGVDGRPPTHPWDPAELEAATDALSQLHHLLTPSPVRAAVPATERLAGLFGGWGAMASSGAVPDTLDPWARGHLDALAALEERWPEALAGGTLLHSDVRSDNLLVTPDGVVFVDWPHACIGAPVFDVVAWAPSVVLEGGPEPEALLARHALSRDADLDAVAALVAAFSGFLVLSSLRLAPPGLPTLRAFQAAQGKVALRWLERLTGW